MRMNLSSSKLLLKTSKKVTLTPESTVLQIYDNTNIEEVEVYHGKYVDLFSYPVESATDLRTFSVLRLSSSGNGSRLRSPLTAHVAVATLHTRPESSGRGIGPAAFCTWGRTRLS
jgi:hypothetical protein